MSRYLQKISLKPYNDIDIWAGWDLEGRTGEISGLVLADDMTEEQLAGFGVTEFQKIPAEYLETRGFLRKP